MLPNLFDVSKNVTSPAAVVGSVRFFTFGTQKSCELCEQRLFRWGPTVSANGRQALGQSQRLRGGRAGGRANPAGLINLVRSSDPRGCVHVHTYARARASPLRPSSPPPRGTRLRLLSVSSFTPAPRSSKAESTLESLRSQPGLREADSTSITSRLGRLQFSRAVSSINRLITR